jgi:hypothetical protein
VEREVLERLAPLKVARDESASEANPSLFH